MLGVLAAAAVAAVLLTSGGGSDNGQQAKTTAKTTAKPAANAEAVPADLKPVPTNRVAGSGNAKVTLDGTNATVTVNTTGLLNGGAHPMHIHAEGQGQCPPASAAKLHNGNRAIATLDGARFYGRPVKALTTKGDTSPDSILAFSRFPHTGTIAYTRRIKLGRAVAREVRSNNAVVVVHGIDYNRNGLYDGTLDRSDLNRSLPGEATAPALCGRLIAKKESSGATAKKPARGYTTGSVRPGGPGPVVYAATLAVASDVPEFRCTLVRGGTPAGHA